MVFVQIFLPLKVMVNLFKSLKKLPPLSNLTTSARDTIQTLKCSQEIQVLLNDAAF